MCTKNCQNISIEIVLENMRFKIRTLFIFIQTRKLNSQS